MMFHMGRVPPFLRLNNSPLYVRTIFFIPSSISGYLGYFRTLVIVNNIAMNMGVQMSLQDTDFICLNRYPAVGLLDPMAVLRVPMGNFIQFSLRTAPFYIPINSA